MINSAIRNALVHIQVSNPIVFFSSLKDTYKRREMLLIKKDSISKRAALLLFECLLLLLGTVALTLFNLRVLYALYFGRLISYLNNLNSRELGSRMAESAAFSLMSTLHIYHFTRICYLLFLVFIMLLLFLVFYHIYHLLSASATLQLAVCWLWLVISYLMGTLFYYYLYSYDNFFVEMRSR